MRLAWATDVHLNFVDEGRRALWAAEVREQRPDALVLTGDIAEAPSLQGILDEVALAAGVPVWFVLGNHDFYRGTIEAVRAVSAERGGRARWLARAGVVELSPRVGLVGVDGWGDGRLGAFERSPVRLNDWFWIGELARAERRGRDARLQALRSLGDEAAVEVAERLPQALKRFEHVVLATHVPPWRAACWHAGQLSNDDWLPWFTCDAVGKAIEQVMDAWPARQLTVLCGHTHGRGRAIIRENVEVLTGGAEYGAPEVQPVLEL